MTGFNRYQNLIVALIMLSILGLTVLGCYPPGQSVIRLSPVFGDTILSCGDKNQSETDGSPFQIKEFGLFLSQISVNDNPITLQKSHYEYVAFLGGPCHDDPQWSLTLNTSIKAGDTLSFDIGLPFSLNHQLPLKQQWPLNNSSMFWSWQTGYKFLRLDLASPDAWSFHLGSTGCSSASSLRAPEGACKQPNVTSITVADYQPDKPILFDIQALLTGIDVSQHRSCLSQPDRPSCQIVFANFERQLVFRQ